MNMRFIDGHIHIGNNPKWTPKIASRYPIASKKYRYYPIEYLKTDLDDAGMHGAVVFAFPEDIYRVEDSKESRIKANKYILEAARTSEHIYPFYFVWNDYIIPEKFEQYAGIKWHRHCDEPNYFYNDPKFFKILEKIKELEMPVLIEEEYNDTVHFIEKNPDLNIIIPHCGQNLWVPGATNRLIKNFDRMKVFFDKPNVHFDTGGIIPGVSLDMIKKILEHVGPKRIILGSDTPYNVPHTELEKILQLGLDKADMKLILSANIERLIARWLKEYPDYKLK